MPMPENLAGLSREGLWRVIAEQQRQIVELTTSVEVWHAEVERLRREGQRQAAPFSKGTRVGPPKKSGRKSGQGPCTHRRTPHPEALTEPPLEVPRLSTTGLIGGGRLAAAGEELASLTDLPEAVRPRVRQFRVAVGRCTACGHRVRGQHPDRAPDQSGATAHRLGARLMAQAHVLHYGLGVPLRKGPVILQQLLGVQVRQSALTQDARRRAAGSVGRASAQLRARGPQAPTVHSDDTGWRVGGEPAHLMAFETAAATV